MKAHTHKGNTRTHTHTHTSNRGTETLDQRQPFPSIVSLTGQSSELECKYIYIYAYAPLLKRNVSLMSAKWASSNAMLSITNGTSDESGECLVPLSHSTPPTDGLELCTAKRGGSHP